MFVQVAENQLGSLLDAFAIDLYQAGINNTKKKSGNINSSLNCSIHFIKKGSTKKKGLQEHGFSVLLWIHTDSVA